MVRSERQFDEGKRQLKGGTVNSDQVGISVLVPGFRWLADRELFWWKNWMKNAIKVRRDKGAF